MSPWQRRARLLIAVAVMALSIVVALTFKGRRPPREPGVAAPTDPKAVVESAGGRTIRVNRDQEDVRIEYDTLRTYPDGSTKLFGVKVLTQRAGGRTFTITGKQGEVGQNEANVSLVGDVGLVASDGLDVRTERATYTDADGTVRAPGPARFSRGRLSGSGLGLTYAKNQDVLTILDQVVVHVAADANGAGQAEISAGTAEISRLDSVIRFNRAVKVLRGSQTIEADAAVAHLSGKDGKDDRLEAVELRGRSRITASKSAVGGLKDLIGRDIDLKYAADGQTLEHAVVNGDAIIEVHGEPGRSGRQIAAGSIDLSFAPDGATPTLLTARESVTLTMPGEPGGEPARTIRAQTLEGTGDPGRGLTRARFSGNVQFRERGADADRAARSGTLDVALAPGLGAIEEANFAQAVRFEEGGLTATSAIARYALQTGTLALRRSEPGAQTPRVVNERIDVNAASIDVTLHGPQLNAAGAVESTLLRAKKSDQAIKLPSMLEEDEPVIVTAKELAYDGAAARATYTGDARLYQGDTSIKAAGSIAIDGKEGDLTARGPVTTTTTLEQDNKDRRKERVATTASAKDFTYEDALRRATYLGDAHVNGPQGDMTAATIELYLKPSGDELERVEAYDSVTLRDQNRKTTGNRMTYHGADRRYVVTGAPVTIVDECGREMTGKTLTFEKGTERLVVDGNEQIRTQTRGGQNCK